MAQLFVNRLTVIDFSYLHSSRGLVGESWQVDIVLRGKLDQQGMVLDFGEVKKSVKWLIDTHFDHKLLVPTDYYGLQLQPTEDVLELSFTTTRNQVIRHRSPLEAVQQVACEEITPDTLSLAIVQTLMPQMPPNVADIELRLWPEVEVGNYYHYSHGLKQHQGNCQRIAHGHRSRVIIERNGKPAPELEQRWATAWRDIYIGTREDLIWQRDGSSHFAYHSPQGQFELTLPSERCYLIESDSTVENIAQHIADTLSQKYPNDSFKVMAFEGVDKGAIGLQQGKSS